MLLTTHNLTFYQHLMQAMREAIAAGKFAPFVSEFHRAYYANEG
jgi:queuine tRNA-ribosyltransferase